MKILKEIGKLLLTPFAIIGSMALILIVLSLIDYGFYLLSPILVILIGFIILYNLYRFVRYIWRSI